MATAWRSKVLVCWWVRIKATTCVSSHCLSTCSYFRVPRSNLPIASYSIEPTFSISSIHLQSLFSLLSTGAGACYTASSDGVGVVQPPMIWKPRPELLCVGNRLRRCDTGIVAVQQKVSQLNYLHFVLLWLGWRSTVISDMWTKGRHFNVMRIQKSWYSAWYLLQERAVC